MPRYGHQSKWLPLYSLALIISLTSKSHLSPLPLPQIFTNAIPTDEGTNQMSPEEKLRRAQEYLNNLNAQQAKASAQGTKQKEREARQARIKERELKRQQEKKGKYTQAEREERRRRAQEYLKWKEQQENESQNDGEELELELDFSYFLTPKPRDLFEGTKYAISNIFRGGFYGLAAFLGTPLTMAAEGGLLGLVKGVVAGALLGIGMPVAGVGVAVYQMVRGLVAQPAAIKDGFIDCKVWNSTGGAWEEYRLDEDLNKIKDALDEEETKSGSRKSEFKASQKVKSTEYYDMLGVKPDATPSNIRSAYRKKARDVHPDKNPDDPEAEQKFRELSAAYQTLSDPAKRAQYDMSGVGVDPEAVGGGEGFTLDPFVFFAVLFGSEQVESYVGELGLASSFDALMKLFEVGSGSTVSFDSWEDVKSVLGWSENALKQRKRETDIAIFLRKRISDYVDGYLTGDAFKESCRVEAENIANGGSYGTSFLSAMGPALVAEADAFLGYRASVIGSWRGPISGIKRNMLFMRRKFSFAKAILRTVKESFKALYDSAEVSPDENDPSGRSENVKFQDPEKLKSNFANTIPSLISMAWAINFLDISNTLSAACAKLFSDASVSSRRGRLRRAEAIQILGSQFYLVAMEITGGNTTLTADIDDIKARATTAFEESMKKGMEKEASRSRSSDEM